MTSEISPDAADSREATILIVEDERNLADMYAAYLDGYDIETACGGEEAIARLSGAFDVVVLDRRMPVVSGDEVLAAIEKRGLDCRVVMVTAVDPDFDITDLRIDDYVIKPITRAELRETVDRLLTLDEYNDRMRELTSKKLKRNVLEVEKTRGKISESEESERLRSEIAALESEVDSLADELEIEPDREV